MMSIKEFPLSDKEAQILSAAWHSRRGAALLIPDGPDVVSTFQADLIDAARRVGAFQTEPGLYSYGIGAAGLPVLRWARRPSVAGASLSIGFRGIGLETNPDGSFVVAKAQ